MAQLVMKQLYPGRDVSDLNESERQTISILGTLAAGLAGGLARGDTGGAVSAAQTGKNAVENNALSDIIENQASGMSQEEKYQKAQNALVKATEEFTEEFKAQNCAGLSAEACGAKMDAHRDELLKGSAEAGLDFVQVVGTVKTLAEAQTALDYLYAAATIIPGERIASGILNSAEKALKKGDVAEASKLLHKASDEVNSTKYFGQERKYWSAEAIQFKGNKVYQRNDLFDPKYVYPKSGKKFGINADRSCSNR
ncbi:VENN motif pre-toxin domain-containing protein [Serratia symbiotica]|nr:VENN motif pre-toxin domain-containing protein [Serratia symbiotica]USS95149.1 VENN motif pre-toxin domain-containing protein [Serratia symbiotica]